MRTPWGQSDSVVDLGRGVLRVDTPSHGGYKLDATALLAVPLALRTPFAGYGWFEEDCDWIIVALAFPGLFTRVLNDGRTAYQRAVEVANHYAKRNYPADDPFHYLTTIADEFGVRKEEAHA